MVAHVARGLRRVLPGLLLVLATATAGCGSDPPRPLAAAPPGPAPSSETPSDATPSSTAPTSAAPSPPAPSPPRSTYTFPIDARADYGRTHDLYPATDIFANCGSPVRAVTAGSVMELSRVDRFDPKNSQGDARGGLF